MFGWLYVTARHEALRLIAVERRTPTLEPDGDRHLLAFAAPAADRAHDRAREALEAVGALQAAGAGEIYSCATHGVFSRDAIARIAASEVTEVIVTDTIPLPEGTSEPRITVLSVAPLFGEAIKRIHRGESVGALFSSEVELVEEMRFWEGQAEGEQEREPSPVGTG